MHVHTLGWQRFPRSYLHIVKERAHQRIRALVDLHALTSARVEGGYVQRKDAPAIEAECARDQTYHFLFAVSDSPRHFRCDVRTVRSSETRKNLRWLLYRNTPTAMLPSDFDRGLMVEVMYMANSMCNSKKSA